MVSRETLLFWLCAVVLTFGGTAAHSAKVFMEPDINWIPEKDNFAIVRVKLPKQAEPDSSLTFTLTVTGWPGYCMNAGGKNDKSPDLSFVKANQADLSEMGVTWEGRDGKEKILIATWQGKAPTDFSLRVECYDYGAIGEIEAAFSNDETEISKVMVPYDENKNCIADAWEENGWTGDAKDDLEEGPGENVNHGDGLTAFEEYRGFEIKGKHTRTSPNEKDIFIHTMMFQGYGWAKQLPANFTLHLIDRAEVEGVQYGKINSRICKPYFRLIQGVIWIEEDPSTSGEAKNTAGVALGRTPFQGPVRIRRVKIFTEIIRSRILLLGDHTTPKDSMYTDQINKTIAHEIGHCLGLPDVKMEVHNRTIIFDWSHIDSSLQPEDKEFKNPQPASIMQQGLVIDTQGTTFPNYHDSHYCVVPDPVKDYEKAPPSGSDLPNFTAKSTHFQER